MKIVLPELCLVVLIGTSGSGKSTFGRKHFKPTEVVSSDFCRGLVADDELDQTASGDAFDVVHFIANKRLKAGRVTVIDATNVRPEDRLKLVELARAQNCLSVAIVLNTDEKLCYERNALRTDRGFGGHVIRNQRRALNRSLKGIRREGFHRVYFLDTPEEIDGSTVEYVPLWNNLKHETGPFDIIGDIHGCFDELVELLEKLSYKVHTSDSEPRYSVEAPLGRKVIFVGDLVDRGPRTPDVLRLVMSMMNDGVAFCVAGNHDVKLMRQLQGKKVSMTHGLAESVAQMELESDEFKTEVIQFLDKLIGHYVMDEGKLVVAHAGLKEDFHGRSSARVRDFALYGETTGETDEYGLPVRYNWAGDYRGRAMVVYGHTPVPESEWLNNTICLDTGCVFGGKLTALRYPERELVQVQASKVHYEPVRPLHASGTGSRDARHDEELNLTDVIGKRILSTRLQRSITIREENACAALEVMSRFAMNPRWLVYLPPTMSPCGTSRRPGYLEYPEEALSYYSEAGIEQVICEEKHMGSRAIVVLCKNEEAAATRFGVRDEGSGACYTRTGRRFFNEEKLERQFLERLRDAVTEAELWSELNSDWMLLDCELMPWSVKAQELLRRQYASTGAAARTAMRELGGLMETAAGRGLDVDLLRESFGPREQMVNQYIDAYRRYCWNVESIKDIKVAPFHLLASEGASHFDKDHLWHMSMLSRLARVSAEELVIATNYKLVNLLDSEQRELAMTWWEQLTDGGGEGMVVKPLSFVSTGPKGLVQPAVKCRGKEYLRIIYGPEYSDERYLDRLRQRGLAMKRSLAMREFALGVESVQRFVDREPLYRIHECVFGVLALESEPVDPRL